MPLAPELCKLALDSGPVPVKLQELLFWNLLSSFYFSVVTLTTLGYGDVLPASLGAQVVVLFEVIMGYIMLGGLLSIFATKMGRRAE